MELKKNSAPAISRDNENLSGLRQYPEMVTSALTGGYVYCSLGVCVSM